MQTSEFSGGNEIPSIENKRSHIEDLWDFDDATFFTAGACHVFALELHRRYGYPLWLVEKGNGRISHVYCLRDGHPFDAKAGKENPRYFFLNFEGKKRETTAAEVESFFTGENWDGVKYGLWGEPSFVKKASERARRLIEDAQFAPVQK